MKPSGIIRRRKRATVLALAAVLAGGLGFWGFRVEHAAPSIPTAVVRREAFVNWVQLSGQIVAPDSALISAGAAAGDYKILSLAANGTRVKKGDVIAQFDATALEQATAQDGVALRSAEADVEQARAGARLKEDKDLTTVMTDRYNVQRAQLEASKAEIVSRIEGEENQLKLADAKAALAAAEAALKGDQAADAANIRGKEQASDQAAFQLRQDRDNLARLTIRAPREGVVSLTRYLWDQQTQQERPWRPGDNVWPGAPIATMPNLSKLEVVARVDESQRGQLAAGQQAEIRFSAVPARSFTGRVESISAIASVDFSAGWPPPRDFTVRIALEGSDPTLLPDETGTVRIGVNRVANGIVVPTEAVFLVNGQRTAYVLEGRRFEARGVVVTAESGGDALIAKGLNAGERVALKNPAPPS